jgi:hypothetical protein
MSERWEIWLDDPAGNRIALLDTVIGCEVNLALNDYGAFELRLPANFDVQLLRLDNIIEFWRGVNDFPLKPVAVGFLRFWKRGRTPGGERYILIGGPTENELLERRIVAYKAGTAQAQKTTYADDMCKAVVDENLGNGAVDTDRDLESSGLLSIETNASAGTEITKGFSHRNVLRVLKDIAAESSQRDDPLYFGLVMRMISNTRIGFIFKVRMGQWGQDRSTESDNPVLFGEAFGNIANQTLTIDYRGERNVAYVGGGGEGEARIVEEVENIKREYLLQWNRREIFVDQRISSDSDTLQGMGKSKLNECRPKWKYTADLLDTPQAMYGVDWEIGDKITIADEGQEYTGVVQKVRIGFSADEGPILAAKFEMAGSE